VKDHAAEAESRRSAGDAHAAVEIAERGLALDPGNDRLRMVLALALIDLGDVPRARRELAAGCAPARRQPGFASAQPEFAHAQPDFGDSLGDDELEHAFAHAETNPDEMMSANRVVEQTLENEHVDVPEVGFDITGSPTYATATMAALLEEQGRAGQAHALREALELELENESTHERLAPQALLDAAEVFEDDGSQPFGAADSDWTNAGVGPDHANRLRVVSTLESWLHNLRNAQELRDVRQRAGGPSST